MPYSTKAEKLWKVFSLDIVGRVRATRAWEFQQQQQEQHPTAGKRLIIAAAELTRRERPRRRWPEWSMEDLHTGVTHLAIELELNCESRLDICVMRVPLGNWST